jgi:hypothetical protein
VAWLTADWPWLILAFAVFNVLRSGILPASLIAPGLIAAVALGGLAASHRIRGVIPLGIAIPGLLLPLGVALLFSARPPMSRPGRTLVLLTGRIVGPSVVGDRAACPRLTYRAVVGEVRADLTESVLDGAVAIVVTTIVGHVHLTVPHTWPLVVQSTGTVLTRVTDTGPRLTDPSETAGVELHLLGLSGAVTIVRV